MRERLRNQWEQSARKQEVKQVEIAHYPTPVAQTVFNREYHFQLKSGRLVPVPMDELVDLVKQEIRVKAEKLKAANLSQTIETVGPVGNFRLQYLLASGQRMVSTPSGQIPQKYVEFKRFILLPIFRIGRRGCSEFDSTGRWALRIVPFTGSKKIDNLTMGLSQQLFPVSANQKLVV